MSDIALRRWIYLFLVASSTFLAVWQLWLVLRVDGLGPPEFAILFLFTVLFAWIVMSFWLACFGFAARVLGARVLPLVAFNPAGRSRTAILMPVYNEDVAVAFGGLRAIFEELKETRGFDFFILSDSTDPSHWVAEEIAWQRLRALPGSDAIYYRHRPRNIGRKSGNIQDFCENWGSQYDYMVVLDADSLMTADCLRGLVALMDANPRAALIQAPAQLTGRNSVFARLQQFSSSLYGPMVTRGLAWLQGADGNYWGHNAILRVKPFMDHCGLPKLPGKPPFGGEIMSHDFVEAALLCRAGWECWMAPDLGGSFEAPTPTMIDNLKRDRRWCQGNLQHLRIVFAEGLTLPSRLHLALGIMTYLSAPLWLMLLLVSAFYMTQAAPPDLYVFVETRPGLAMIISHAATLLTLVMVTAILLLGPKLLALAEHLISRKARDAHGGALGLSLSVLLETLISALFAPIVMLSHSGFVLSILTGSSSGWGSQDRHDRAVSLKQAVRYFWPHTLAGAVATLLLFEHAAHAMIWFTPLLAGLLLSIPLVSLTSSLKLGLALKSLRLLQSPSETTGIPIVTAAHALSAEFPHSENGPHHLVLDDEQVRALHLALLADLPPPAIRERLPMLVARAKNRDFAGFTREDWMLLLSDPESLARASA